MTMKQWILVGALVLAGCGGSEAPPEQTTEQPTRWWYFNELRQGSDSWGRALPFFEYWLAVPANRIGHQVYSAAQLKTMQEIITLLVFAVFSVTYLGESLKWNHMVAFMFLCGAAFFSFHKWA